ncbi:MAG TPA: phosphopantothenoylcysteine decarboxylase [Phycisphaerae bacterium]|nr:phosphopantothenoylcysteine decarboxylase [Phycisphaerae bacterium]
MPRRTAKRLRILITAGPTREYLDSVRFISNPSSGKMGYALATAARAAGHEVTLVSGPVAIAAPAGIRTVHVETTGEMAAAAKKAFAKSDVAVFTAAVCDYRPQKRSRLKMPKRQVGMSLTLVPTIDIAATLGRRKGRRITVAFALEDHAARRHAEEKLRRKACDAIVLNRPSSIGADHARMEFLVRGEKWQAWPVADKRVIARRLIQEVEKMAGER